MKKKGRPLRDDVSLRVVEQQELSEEELEGLAQLLARWWIREFEEKNRQLLDARSSTPTQQNPSPLDNMNSKV